MPDPAKFRCRWRDWLQERPFPREEVEHVATLLAQRPVVWYGDSDTGPGACAYYLFHTVKDRERAVEELLRVYNPEAAGSGLTKANARAIVHAVWEGRTEKGARTRKAPASVTAPPPADVASVEPERSAGAAAARPEELTREAAALIACAFNHDEVAAAPTTAATAATDSALCTPHRPSADIGASPVPSLLPAYACVACNVMHVRRMCGYPCVRWAQSQVSAWAAPFPFYPSDVAVVSTR